MNTNEDDDLTLREAETGGIAELTEDGLEITILDHFADDDRLFSCWHARYIETPCFEVRADVAEDVVRLCDGSCAIVRREDDRVTVRNRAGVDHILTLFY